MSYSLNGPLFSPPPRQIWHRFQILHFVSIVWYSCLGKLVKSDNKRQNPICEAWRVWSFNGYLTLGESWGRWWCSPSEVLGFSHASHPSFKGLWGYPLKACLNSHNFPNKDAQGLPWSSPHSTSVSTLRQSSRLSSPPPNISAKWLPTSALHFPTSALLLFLCTVSAILCRLLPISCVFSAPYPTSAP